jgi:hypothetical protein
MDVKRNTVLIIAIIVLIGSLSFVTGYMYISGAKNQQNPVNVTPLNETVTNGTQIPYSSEYITFNKAKSIAKSKASKGVIVSDPILIKDKSGEAVYICYYSYNGNSVGGIILNAKTGAVIYRSLDIPADVTEPSNDYYYTQDSTTDNSYDNQDNSYDNGYDDYSDTSDDYYNDDQSSDYNYDDQSYDDSGDYNY